VNKMGTGVTGVGRSDPPPYRPLSPLPIFKVAFTHCNNKIFMLSRVSILQCGALSRRPEYLSPHGTLIPVVCRRRVKSVGPVSGRSGFELCRGLRFFSLFHAREIMNIASFTKN